MNASKSGFTLVELLLTLGVLVVGMTSTIAMVVASTNYSRANRNLREMDAFAESVFTAIHASARGAADEEAWQDLTVKIRGPGGLQPITSNGENDWWPEDPRFGNLGQIAGMLHFEYTLELRLDPPGYAPEDETLEAVLTTYLPGEITPRVYRRLIRWQRRAW
ncbi:MAG: hypothetical protein JJU29_06515 [Verrucomicrobia bacterium]|nr:hypothetical protein [Verrucomicrobiota bacterium]MCH8510317.1 hypothetical protein [Kiritimatiellia bacterium]